jgi:hypothetical protein
MKTYGMAARLFLGCLLCFGISWQTKAADSEDSIVLEFDITSVKPITEAYLKTKQDDTRVECPAPAEKPTEAKSAAGGPRPVKYRCKIEKFHDAVDSITIYQLFIDSTEIDPKPISIRVNPATPQSTVIALNLTDSIFLKSWSGTGYWKTFFSTTNSKSDDDLTAYLITKNYYYKLKEGKGKDDNETLRVLQRWLDRAIAIASAPPSARPYLAIDGDVIERLEGLFKSDDNNGKPIIDEIISSGQREQRKTQLQKDLASLKIGDFFLFRNPPKFNQSDIKPRQPDFCKLHKALLAMWKKDDPTPDDKLISNTYNFSGTNLEKPDKAPFKECVSPTSTAGPS